MYLLESTVTGKNNLHSMADFALMRRLSVNGYTDMKTPVRSQGTSKSTASTASKKKKEKNKAKTN